MNKQLLEVIPGIFEQLPSPGILLLCGNGKKENLITIGWLQVGWLWQEMVINIFIRPSRYSYHLLLENRFFTLNVLPGNFQETITFCGTNSGRYCDKFKETNLARIPSRKISVSSLKDAKIILECQIINQYNLTQENLSDIIIAKFYNQGDFHDVFSAKILYMKQL